jgi:hypothetical protein
VKYTIISTTKIVELLIKSVRFSFFLCSIFTLYNIYFRSEVFVNNLSRI